MPGPYWLTDPDVADQLPGPQLPNYPQLNRTSRTGQLPANPMDWMGDLGYLLADLGLSATPPSVQQGARETNLGFGITPRDVAGNLAQLDPTMGADKLPYAAGTMMPAVAQGFSRYRWLDKLLAKDEGAFKTKADWAGGLNDLGRAIPQAAEQGMGDLTKFLQNLVGDWTYRYAGAPASLDHAGPTTNLPHAQAIMDALESHIRPVPEVADDYASYWLQPKGSWNTAPNGHWGSASDTAVSLDGTLPSDLVNRALDGYPPDFITENSQMIRYSPSEGMVTFHNEPTPQQLQALKGLWDKFGETRTIRVSMGDEPVVSLGKWLKERGL